MKSISYNQILKIKHPDWDQPSEIRVGVRDLSLIFENDQQDIRFRKSKTGIEIRIYSKKHSINEEIYEDCNMGHRHPIANKKQLIWISVALTAEQVGEFREWLTDGHHKWKL